MSVGKKLDQILGINDPKDQTNQFTSVIDEVVAAGNNVVNHLRMIGDKVLTDEVQQQVTRNVLLHFAKSVSNIDGDDQLEICNYMITAIKQNVNSYDEADYLLRETLFDYYVACEQYSDAAQILSGVNFDSTSKIFSDKEKANIHVKCAEAYLEDQEAVSAETCVNRASALINSVDDVSLILRYRVTYARVMDANRKFLEAAVRYYEISTTTGTAIVQGDLLALYGKAVTCAILGKAGQQRTRVLGLLFQDDRLSSLDLLPEYASHATVLTKMYKKQILKSQEMEVFETSLMPHQKATTSDGFTIPEKAVIEHNMVATGIIYDNIRIVELGKILRLDEPRVEKLAAAMITENRLKASIDQTEGVLIFEEDNNPLLSWDAGINEICNDISELSDAVQPSLIVA